MIRSGRAPEWSQPRSVSAHPSYSPSRSGSSGWRSSTRTTTLSSRAMSSAGTSSSASATSSSNRTRGTGFTARPSSTSARTRPAVLYRLSPAGRQRPALLVAGGALHPQHRPLVQLVDRAGPGVGARGPDAGHDAVDEVLDARPGGVQVHPGRADALFEQPGAGPLEPGGPAGACLHRAGRGHPEALLVPAAGAVVVQVAGALVGAGEPGADH